MWVGGCVCFGVYVWVYMYRLVCGNEGLSWCVGIGVCGCVVCVFVDGCVSVCGWMCVWVCVCV